MATPREIQEARAAAVFHTLLTQSHCLDVLDDDVGADPLGVALARGLLRQILRDLEADPGAPVDLCAWWKIHDTGAGYVRGVAARAYAWALMSESLDILGRLGVAFKIFAEAKNREGGGRGLPGV